MSEFQRAIEVEERSFRHNEVIVVRGTDNVFQAGYGYGMATEDITQELLRQKKTEKSYDNLLKKSEESLNKLRKLSKESPDTFTTSDGVNHLEQYLHMVRGFSWGAGIKEEETASIQISDQLGCQTLLVQNTQTGEIAGIHTEEDETQGRLRKDSTWGKRWVKVAVGDKRIEFCSYAGICSWGGTSGIVENVKTGETFFQAADSLWPVKEGYLWANAVAFMFMDAGKIDLVNELVEKFKKMPKPTFSGGYVLHMVEGGKPPKLATVEFGNGVIDFIPLQKSYDLERKIASGTNFPRHADLALEDAYTQPRKENESDDKYQYRLEERAAMERRLRRLTLIGQLVAKDFTKENLDWDKEKVLDLAEKVMQYSRGDLLGEWFSGLANYLVAQNDALYVSPEGKMKLIVNRGSQIYKRKK